MVKVFFFFEHLYGLILNFYQFYENCKLNQNNFQKINHKMALFEFYTKN